MEPQIYVIHWTLRRQLDLLDMKAPNKKAGRRRQAGSGIGALRRVIMSIERYDMHGLKLFSETPSPAPH